MTAHARVMKKRMIQHHEAAKDTHQSITREDDWFWCVAAQCKVRACNVPTCKRYPCNHRVANQQH